MVIHQFNKLIRNKWVWGVFAVAVSAAFCFDDLFTSRNREERVQGSAGTLAGENVKSPEFNEIADDIRGVGRNRDWKRPAAEVNRSAWETIAALKVAEKNGIVATDSEVAEAIRSDRSFQQNGAFSFRLYQMLLRENGMTPEHFEQYLKRQLTLRRINADVLGDAAWVSPMELDRAVADMTDELTVKIATFKQTKEEAAAVKLDDAGIRKWYDENTNSIALPERVKIRYVKYSANDQKVLDKMVVTEDEMRDQYDATIEKYTSTDTNGVETVKKFEDVKDGIEKDLRKIAAVQYFETNLTARAYAPRKEGDKTSRLDEIAKEDGLKVETSDWFTVDGNFVAGFMKRAGSILPGAEAMTDAVAQLDPESEDLRYGVVLGKDAAWLIERADVSKAHVPTFEEAKAIITPKALDAARAEAFKAKVEAIAAKGAAEVAKTPGISTNYTFSVSKLANGQLPDQYAVAGAARKLQKGEVSEFVKTGKDSAVLVICEDRKEGDATEAVLLKGQVRDQLAMLARRQIPEGWMKWNLERLGFEPDASASVTPEDVSDAE